MTAQTPDLWVEVYEDDICWWAVLIADPGGTQVRRPCSSRRGARRAARRMLKRAKRLRATTGALPPREVIR